MPDETFEQRIERLKSLRTLAVGDRIVIIGSGRTGTVVKPFVRHNGFKIRWDVPVFGVTEGWVGAHLIERA